MKKTTKTKILTDFISYFIAFAIGDIVSDYLGLSKKMFSVDFILRILILTIIILALQFLFSKITYVWNKMKDTYK